MAVFIGGKDIGNYSRFCHEGHLLKASVPLTSTCLSF